MSYADLAERYAREYGIPVPLALELMGIESGGDPNAVSPRGARGLFQVMPATGRDPGFGVTPLRDDSPEENARFGMEYYRALLDRYGGDHRLAQAAYNAGPGAVDRHGGVPPYPETQEYVERLAPVTAQTYGYPSGIPYQDAGGSTMTPEQMIPPELATQTPQAPRQGLFEQMAMHPLFQMGLGILGSNQGHYGALGPALGQGAMLGINNWQQLQALQERQRRLAQGPDDPARIREFDRLVADLIRDGLSPREASAQARRMVWSGGSGAGEKIVDVGGVPYRYRMGPDGFYQMERITTPEQEYRTGALSEEAAAKAEGQEIGKQRGEAIAGYGTAMDNATQSLQVIEGLINHPGRNRAVGLSSVLPTLPGGKSADYEAKLNQLQGKLFLEAFESLKGGGQITEVEGMKATQAISDLSLKQSEEAHEESLKTLRGIYENAKRRAASRAGRSTTIQPGHVEDGYRFKGGNPADPNAWEPAP